MRPSALLRFGSGGTVLLGLLLAGACVMLAATRTQSSSLSAYERTLVSARSVVEFAATQLQSAVDEVRAHSASLNGLDLETAQARVAAGGLALGGVVVVLLDNEAESGRRSASFTNDTPQQHVPLPPLLSDSSSARNNSAWVMSVPVQISGRTMTVTYAMPHERFLRALHPVTGGLAGTIQIAHSRSGLRSDTAFPVHTTVPRPSLPVVYSAQSALDALGTQTTLAYGAVSAVSGTDFVVQVRVDKHPALVALTSERKHIESVLWTALGTIVAGAFALMLVLRHFTAKDEYLRRIATTDPLTGLPNRRSFNHLLENCLKQAQRKGQHLAVYFIDLDNFKVVNDSLGHEAGDDLLRAVASTLLRLTRKQDVVSRLAGDEFMIVAPGVSGGDDAKLIAHRILEGLRACFGMRGDCIPVRASIGVALAAEGDCAAALRQRADAAMYRAKASGKDCCVLFDARVAEDAKLAAQLVLDLEQGILREEFFLEYQPKFALADGTLMGYEALVRWQHPIRGTLPPGRFIAEAERCGLIVDIGRMVLRLAVRQIRQWHRQDGQWRQVAVNISALQLKDELFASSIEQLLAEYEVPGNTLQLELTESYIATNAAAARRVLTHLQRIGVSVAIDDFGTGYSSLGALQHFDINCLKIDKSFVDTILTREGEEICRALISLGQALRIRVVAEGVETHDQAVKLQSLGCDEVQGYLYAKALSADDAFGQGSVMPPTSNHRNNLRHLKVVCEAA